MLTVEKGDGSKGKELIEEALRRKGNLLHADYNLGRAEMLLGNNAAALEHLERERSSHPIRMRFSRRGISLELSIGAFAGPRTRKKPWPRSKN